MKQANEQIYTQATQKDGNNHSVNYQSTSAK